MVEQSCNSPISQGELRSMAAMNMLYNFAANNIYCETDITVESYTTIPEIGHALQTAFAIPKIREDKPPLRLPALDRRYDVGEIDAAEVPVQFITAITQGTQINLFGHTLSAGKESNDFTIIVPTCSEGNNGIAAMDYRGEKLYSPGLTAEMSEISGYMKVLREAVKGMITAVVNMDLINMYNDEHPFESSINRDQNYSMKWARLVQVAHDRDTTAPEDIPEIASNIANDIVGILEENNFDVPESLEEPLVVDCCRDRSKFTSPGFSDKSTRTIEFSKSEGTLYITKRADQVQPEHSPDYTLTLPLEGDASGLVAVNMTCGRVYCPTFNSEDISEHNGYYSILQMAARDILAIAYLPPEVISI
jgi:hypothetical protein